MYDIKKMILGAVEQMGSIDTAAFIKAIGHTVVISTTEGHHVYYDGLRVGYDDIGRQYAAIGDFKRFRIAPEEAAQWLGMNVVRYLAMESTFSD